MYVNACLLGAQVLRKKLLKSATNESAAMFAGLLDWFVDDLGGIHKAFQVPVDTFHHTLIPSLTDTGFLINVRHTLCVFCSLMMMI